MRAQRFQGGSVTTALAAVRHALGADAVLLGIETAPGGTTVVTAARAAAPPPAPREDARIELVVGPPGDGKTTLVGKRAVAARRLGARVLVIGTDTHRVGATFELAALGRTIGATVCLAPTKVAVSDAIAATPAADCILVDTTGVGGAGTAAFADVLSIACALGDRARRTLVVSATTAPGVLAAAWETYGALAPAAAVVTKADLAPWEPLASQIVRLGVPVIGCSRSRSVAQDVTSIDRDDLARRLLIA